MRTSLALTPRSIKEALSIKVWDFANDVLYRLCKENPEHTRDDIIIAKVWLIGRTYAAAIERGAHGTDGPIGDAFYEKEVASTIRESPIDVWFRALDGSSNCDLSLTLETHKKVMDLFCRISGLEKRSLASKYLHFHFPAWFYIYDSRAHKAISSLTGRVGRNLPSLREHDDVYARFFIRCDRLRQDIIARSGERLLPREIDKILLHSAR